MENALVTAALSFAGLTSVVTLVLFFKRMRDTEKISTLQQKLTLEQAKRSELELSLLSAGRKPETKTKSQPEKNPHSAELLELRKNNSHLKDELKQLKQELRKAEHLGREHAARSEGDSFKLRSENQALIERLKEIENNSVEKRKSQQLEAEMLQLREQLRTLQEELGTAAAKLRAERGAADKSKKTIDAMQIQLTELRSRLPEAGTAGAAPTDPKALERWKDRALTARQMYQMMRQMRELSDLKLASYQDAIIDVTSQFMTLKGINSPVVGPQENKADRYLAEAWSLIQGDTSADA